MRFDLTRKSYRFEHLEHLSDITRVEGAIALPVRQLLIQAIGARLIEALDGRREARSWLRAPVLYCSP